MSKKLTVQELIKRKSEIKDKKANKPKQQLYIKSLDGYITIEQPSQSLVLDALEMDEEGDKFLVYECVIEPKLKSTELHSEFGVKHNPIKITQMIFEAGEIAQIAQKCLELAGYGDTVEVVKDIKN